MRALATVYNSSGTVIGDGPLTTITSVTYRRSLDSIGQATVNFPAADPRASLTAVKGRITVRRPLPSGVLTDMFTESIIAKRDISDSDSGAEITLTCLDKIALLEDANTRVGLKFNGDTLDDVLTDLLALSSGFTHSFVDGGLSTLVVSKRFDGATVLAAIKEVLALHGLHWYAVGGTLYVTSGGSLANGVLFNMRTAPASFGSSTPHALIESISQEEDADGLVTKLFPLGKGDGNNALTLRVSTESSPYTIQSETGPNGKTQYFISDAAAVTAYGTITKVVKFDDISPTEDTKAARVIAANQLYDAAAVHLARMKQPVMRYTVGLKVPNTAYGNFGVPRPGEKRRVIYRGYSTQPDEIPPVSGAEAAYLSLDEELWVVGVQESLNLSGYSTSVELADYDVPAETAAGKIVSGIQSAKAGALLQSVDPRLVGTVQTSDATVTTIVSTPALAASSGLMLDGFLIGTRSNFTAGLVARIVATFRRESSGNIQPAIESVGVIEDSASGPTVTVDVDTSAQTGRVRVTGVAAQNWNWKIVYTITAMDL